MSLFLPSFICVLILILHSYYFRGWRITLAFFLSAYVLHALWGLSDAHGVSKGQWDYLPIGDPLGLTYKGIPYGSFVIVIPIGWVFAQYIGWCIAETILRDNPKKHNAFFPIVALSILGMTLIGLCMEWVNEAIRWWQWRHFPSAKVIKYIAVWMLKATIFYNLFFMFYIEGPRKHVVRGGIVLFLVLYISLAAYAHASQNAAGAALLLVSFAQFFLYCINSVKLQPMRKKDIETKEPA